MRRLVEASVAALVLTLASAARGYCRNTTCADDCVRDDDGCKQSGAPLAWPSSCVGFSLQRDGTAQLPLVAVEAAVRRAFAAWSARDCADGGADLVLLEDAMASCAEPEHNEDEPNAHVIMFHDGGWPDDAPSHAIARTTVDFDPDTGAILDADIEVDSKTNRLSLGSPASCADCIDLQAVLTHEVGHFIGLDHTIDRRATMSPGYRPGTTAMRSLDDDDLAAVCNAYPTARRAPCAPEPRNGFDGDCRAADGCAVSPAGAGEGWPWLVGVSVAAVRRRRSLRARLRCARDTA